jgi:hypothetical protein
VRGLIKDAECKNFKYDAEEVETAVINTVLNFAIKYRDEIKEKLLADEDITEGLAKKVNDLRSEYNRLIKAYQRLGDENILDDAEKINFEIKRYEKDIEAEKEKKGITKTMEEKADLLKTLPDVWQKMDDKQKQNVIRSLVERVELSEGNLKVYLKKSEYDQLLVGDEKNLLDGNK